MSRRGFQAVSRRISAEKTVKYVGRAEVNIQNLEFPNSKSSNEENIERLARLFRGQGSFSPGDVPNRVPAVIDEAALQTVLTASGLTRDSLLCGGNKHPRLVFQEGFRLECLRGGDRVKASKKVSRSSNPHWVVDLFTADISDEAKRDLIEEYSSEKKPQDGVYYRKIREYQGIFGGEHPYLEHRWWARLAASSKSENKKERLEQLWKHPRFAPAFDAFRHLPALYCGLRLSAINKMISMRCHEELLSFLRHIKDFWHHIFGGDESAMERLDEDTVLALQLKAPGACEKEERTLYAQVHSGCLFGGFNDTERNGIWLRLCSATVDCLVPSLYAFFENLKYMQAAADCMRRLVPREARKSMRRSFEDKFSTEDADESDCIIQTSWSSFRSIPMPSADSFDVAYRQLWLYALREQQSMPIPRKQKLAIAETRHADEIVVFRFACLAQKLGFKSEEIKALVQRNPDQAIALRLLTTARKADEFEYEDLSTSIQLITQIFSTAQLIPEQLPTEEDDVDDIAIPPVRCGTPHAVHHSRDKHDMFLGKLHAPMHRHGSDLSSFFIQRSIYFAFFSQDIDVPIVDLQVTEGVKTLDYIVLTEQISPVPSLQSQRLARTLGGDAREQALQSRVEEQETRLRQLAMQEQQLAANAEQLQNDFTAQNRRILALRDEERDTLARLSSLQHAEVEQVLRLEALQTDKQTRQSEIAELEQRRASLEEEIRLDLLAQVQLRAQVADLTLQVGQLNDERRRQEEAPQVQQLVAEEERLRAQVADLTLQVGRLNDERQRQEEAPQVQQLVAEEERLRAQVADLTLHVGRLNDERQRQEEASQVQQLVAEEERLRAQVADLTLYVGQLNDERRRQDTSMEVMEKYHISTVERLLAIESALRSEVEQLVAEEERLRAQVADLTLHVGQLNDDRQRQVASMVAVETQHISTVEGLVARESALRSEIEQLEAILQQLQARFHETAASEKDAGVEKRASVGSGFQPPSPPAPDGRDEAEESSAANGQQTGLALEHMVREALHSSDEVSNASDATENAGNRPSAASVSATEQLVDTSEVVQQDRGQVVLKETEKVFVQQLVAEEERLRAQVADLTLQVGRLNDERQRQEEASQVQQLVAEEERLRAQVADLTLHVGRLNDERQRQEEASQVQQLVAEEERLRAQVADLTLYVGQLNDDRQRQVASMVAVETQHISTVEGLVARESALRSEIEQLEAILQQLQARFHETAASEKDAGVEKRASVGSGVQPPSPPAPGTDVPEIARRDGCDETEQNSAASGQQTGLALEHMVREALHSSDEVSNASDATENAGNRRPSAASVPATEQLVDTSEVVQQDRGQIVPNETEKVSVVFKLFLDGEWRTQHKVEVDPAEPSAVQRAAARTVLGE